MDFKDLVKPFKRKVVIEAFVRAIATGLLYGSGLSLLLAFIFRVIAGVDMQQLYVVLTTIGAGVACAIAIGVVTYKKRYAANASKVARRIDSLGLDERYTTMVEYRKDKSYVAKVQREDTHKRLAKLDAKALKVNTPYVKLVSVVAIIVAIILLFLIPVKADESAMEDLQDVQQTIDDAFQEIEDKIEESEVDEETKEELKEEMQDFKEQLQDMLEKPLEKDETVQDRIEEVYEEIREKEEEIQDQLEKDQEIIDELKKDETTEDLADALDKQDKEEIVDSLEKMEQQLTDPNLSKEEKQEILDQIQESLDNAINKDEQELK
ncbi:MAG: hypothetical protein IKA02_00825, partial [Clostridia bacterium]|nr:hypothetical protein [Clostridia bacterium]